MILFQLPQKRKGASQVGAELLSAQVVAFPRAVSLTENLTPTSYVARFPRRVPYLRKGSFDPPTPSGGEKRCGKTTWIGKKLHVRRRKIFFQLIFLLIYSSFPSSLMHRNKLHFFCSVVREFARRVGLLHCSDRWRWSGGPTAGGGFPQTSKLVERTFFPPGWEANPRYKMR